MQRKKILQFINLSFKQRGAALILFAVTLILVVFVYAVKSLNGNDLQARQNEKTLATLSEAKSALIAWAVNNVHRPGLMPYPDRGDSDGNYDGNSDCYTTTTLDGNYDKLLGKLPWLAADDANCATLVSGIGQEFKDSSGEHLWYAVSRNLVYDYKNSAYPIINPSIIDNPSYPWMEVYDKNGQLISNKVAAVIIAPGAPLDDQDRSSGTADATNYLDRFDLQVGGGTKSNRQYAGSDEDFYMGEDSRGVRSDSTIYQQPYYFNDKLVYITIDELMAEIEKRVAGEARLALQSYYTNSSVTPSARFFPYAAALGSTANPNQCVTGNLQGLLPINPASSYTCSYATTTIPRRNNSATCSFAAVSSISFTRLSGTYSSRTNACQNIGATCRCTGAGTCRIGATDRFRCDACGVCTTIASSSTNGSGYFSFITSTGTFSPGGGATFGSNLTANSTGSFSLSACADPNPGLSRVIISATTSNSNTLTTASNFNVQRIRAGMFISGAGISSGTTVSSVSSSTTLTMSKNATASGANNLTFSILPDWFSTNSWQNYIYYAVSNNCTSSGANCTTDTSQLTVGTRTDIRALLISSGKPIIASPLATSKAAAQVARPSCDVKDYLDSIQNTNVTLVNGGADLVYDAVNSTRSPSYNDQMFIVAP